MLASNCVSFAESNLHNYIKNFSNEFDSINVERKKVIEEISNYIVDELNSKGSVNLIFICTHNSRRSHISQLWAIAACDYLGIDNVHCYSGGTEVTAFNPRAVRALQKAGFIIEKLDESSNPRYICKISNSSKEIIAFSKKFDDEPNPKSDFIAIMVCSQADESCPFILGANNRFSLNYDDPKEYDNTPQEAEQYDYTVRLIGREIVYLFSKVKEKLN